MAGKVDDTIKELKTVFGSPTNYGHHIPTAPPLNLPFSPPAHLSLPTQSLQQYPPLTFLRSVMEVFFFPQLQAFGTEGTAHLQHKTKLASDPASG